MPGGLGESTGGNREMVPVLARAAAAVGVAGIFMETHPRPDESKSDGPNSWPLNMAEQLLSQIKAIDEVTKSAPWPEDEL